MKSVVDSQRNQQRGPMRGIVRWFDSARGYGFIARENGRDLFVHYTAILAEGRRVLNDGDRVEFQIAMGRKGPQAEEVRRIEQVPSRPDSQDGRKISGIKL
jgi:cold shock protein